MLNLHLSRRLGLQFLVLVMFGCSAQSATNMTGPAKAEPATATMSASTGNLNSCDVGSPVDIYLATYTIVEIEKYGGGLTTETSAMARVGEKVTLEEGTFKLRDTTIDHPLYRIACHQVSKTEGEVRQDRWSHFYGFAAERDVVEVLEVQDPKSDDAAPEFMFEVIKGDEGIELWEMYDGWIFRMKEY